MMDNIFCMSLNTAGVVLGWLGMVGSFVMTILLVTILGYTEVIAHHIEKSVDGGQQKYDEIHLAIIVMCSIYVAVTAMNFMASSLLVLGTIRQRHLMLLPWLINSGTGLIFGLIYQLYFLAVSMSSGRFPLPGLMLSFLLQGLQIYIYCGIYALFKKIQLTRDQRQSEAAANPDNSYIKI